MTTDGVRIIGSKSMTQKKQEAVIRPSYEWCTIHRVMLQDFNGDGQRFKKPTCLECLQPLYARTGEQNPRVRLVVVPTILAAVVEFRWRLKLEEKLRKWLRRNSRLDRQWIAHAELKQLARAVGDSSEDVLKRINVREKPKPKRKKPRRVT